MRSRAIPISPIYNHQFFLSSGLSSAYAAYREITWYTRPTPVSHRGHDDTVILPPLCLDSNVCLICVVVTSNLSALSQLQAIQPNQARTTDSPTVRLFDTENNPQLGHFQVYRCRINTLGLIHFSQYSAARKLLTHLSHRPINDNMSETGRFMARGTSRKLFMCRVTTIQNQTRCNHY